jgi:molecular chaperone GrpE
MTEHVDQQLEAPAADAPVAGDPEVQEVTADAAAPEETDDLQTLREELAGAREEASANQEKYLRARADMENYKKRIERTYADLARSSKKDLLSKLLAVKDNLERALQYGENANGAAGESIIEGVRLTQYQLDQLLAQEGVREIESEGKHFDPYLEEAVQRVNDPNVPDHTVVQVVRKGYVYKGHNDQDEVLRPAQVIVSVHGEE